MSVKPIAAVCFALAIQAQPQHMGSGHMHRRFDQPEQWTKSFDDPARDQWQMPERVIATLGVKPGQTVADVGAGTGYFTVRLAKAVNRVIASDIEASMVDFIRQRAAKAGLVNVTAVVASAESANLPEPVDVILLVNTYHHILHRPMYFRKLASSLKPGGRLAIVDWRPEAAMGPPKEFKFTVARMAAELESAGFKKAAQHDFLPNQNFVIFSR
jgi:ubiquinone/menaquinone biosynthesis C-methylase UbiE